MYLVNPDILGLPFSIKIHTTRANCSRQPQYIERMNAEARLVSLNGRPAHFYYGVNNPDLRISFEINEVWCYVDDAGLVAFLRNLANPVVFETDGDFDIDDLPD